MAIREKFEEFILLRIFNNEHMLVWFKSTFRSGSTAELFIGEAKQR